MPRTNWLHVRFVAELVVSIARACVRVQDRFLFDQIAAHRLLPGQNDRVRTVGQHDRLCAADVRRVTILID